ncbi:MAG TPA: MMPL family transporter [Gaiellaceae bacterium]|jgi:RND superfamily putative drug exporter
MRLASFVTGRRSRWVVIGFWLVLFAVSLPLSSKLASETKEQYGRPDGSQSKELGHLLALRFQGGDTTEALLVYKREGGLTAADRAVILADAREAESVSLVRQVAPPFGSTAPFGPTNGQVSSDGDVAFTVVSLAQGKVKETNDGLDKLRDIAGGSPGLDAHLTGTIPLLNDLTNIIKEADAKLLLATGLLVLLLLLLIYRSPILAFVPLIVVFISYTVATGLLDMLVKVDLPVSSNATSLLLVLMFGVGTDYCLLLVSRYRHTLHQHESAPEALASAIPLAGPAIVASGLTVMAAILAILASSLTLNRAFAPANAIGIGIVLVASLTLLPAVLSAFGRRAFWPRTKAVEPGVDQPDERERLWGRIGRRVLDRPLRALVIAGLFLGVLSLGLLTYHTEADVLAQFRADTDGTRGVDALKSAFPAGELAPVTVLIDRSSGAVSDADVAVVRQRVLSVDGVAAVTGVVRRSDDGRLATLNMVLAGEPYSNAALERVREVRRAVADVQPGTRVILGGAAADRLDFREAAKHDFAVVAPIALLVIFLTLVLLLRAVVAPLYLLATVLLSFTATLGLSLLIFKYVLDKHSVDPELPLVAFIFLVALGSDYNIFLMHRVREEAHGRSTREGVGRALAATGSVITSAGIVLAGTFAVLTVVPFYFLLELGIIVALGILIDTFIVRTIVVPSIVALVGERSWWPFRSPALEAAPAAEEPATAS